MVKNDYLTTNGLVLAEAQPGEMLASVLMIFCNESSDSKTIQVHVVPSGKSLGNATSIITGVELTVADTFTFSTEKLILDPGSKIVAICDQDDVSVVGTVSYMDIS